MSKAKVIKSLVLMTALAVMAPGCGNDPQGPGSDGLNETGTRLNIEIISWVQRVDLFPPPPGALLPAEMNVQLESIGVLADDDLNTGYDEDEPQSDMYVEGLLVQFLSNDEDAIPLADYHVGLNLHVPVGKRVTIRDVIFFPSDHMKKLTAEGNTSREFSYSCKLIFYGHNQWGYEFSEIKSLPVVLGDYSLEE